ncbi:hypothetical protein [Bacillus velezensis]|uniref:hypothetical protein n=1 Tax=Bacillus velezensis TaxID=492670 RepID=UPI0024BF360C|nr:hypothetical protein [Bacillus velezensis]WHY37828.1 hypothetical protein QNH19_15275 [Bacillus velezensis]
MIVKQIAALIKYNTLSSFRKRKEDWGIPQLNSKLLSAIIISLLCLYLVFLGCGVVFGTKLIQLPLSAWGKFVLIAVSLEQLFWAAGFFKEHHNAFLLDTRKVIHQLKKVRFLQLFSVFAGQAIKKTIFVWYLFVFPVFLFLSSAGMTGSAAVIVFFLGFVYFLLNLFLSMLFSYVVYLLTNMWSKLFYLKIMKGILFSVSLLVPLAVGYAVYLLVFGEYTAKDISSFTESPAFRNILMNTPYVWLAFRSHSVLVFAAAFAAAVLLTAGMFKLWSATLKKMDLIPYMFLTNADFAPKLKLYRNNKIFHAVFQKDLLFLSRIDGFFIRNFGSMLYLFMLFLGFCIPLLSHHFIGYSAAAIVSAAVIIANFSYQLVGDALKTVLSVDGEIKNQHLFHRNIKHAWQLVFPKVCIYNLAALIYSFIITILITVFFPYSAALTIYLFIVFLCSGFLYSLVQISSTALYPKKNWEHLYEIGEAGKAKTYNNLYGSFIFIVSLQIAAITSYFIYKKPELETMLIHSASGIFVLFTLLNYGVMFLFLRRINMAERFANND